MDGLEIAPCSIVSGQLRFRNEGRGPAGALLRGPASRIATVRENLGQQLIERHAVGHLVQAPQDTLAGQRHGMQRQRRGPCEQGQLLLGEKCYCCLTVQHI
jgi:hypothetical protein